MTRAYPGFPECREIKHMRKQWIPGALFPLLRAWVQGYDFLVFKKNLEATTVTEDLSKCLPR